MDLPKHMPAEIVTMNEDRKAQALNKWRSLLLKPELRMTAQEQYEALLWLAEKYSQQGIIDRQERKTLVIEATQQYAQAVEGVGAGT